MHGFERNRLVHLVRGFVVHVLAFRDARVIIPFLGLRHTFPKMQRSTSIVSTYAFD